MNSKNFFIGKCLKTKMTGKYSITINEIIDFFYKNQSPQINKLIESMLKDKYKLISKRDCKNVTCKFTSEQYSAYLELRKMYPNLTEIQLINIWVDIWVNLNLQNKRNKSIIKILLSK